MIVLRCSRERTLFLALLFTGVCLQILLLVGLFACPRQAWAQMESTVYYRGEDSDPVVGGGSKSEYNTNYEVYSFVAPADGTYRIAAENSFNPFTITAYQNIELNKPAFSGASPTVAHWGNALGACNAEQAEGGSYTGGSSTSNMIWIGQLVLEVKSGQRIWFTVDQDKSEAVAESTFRVDHWSESDEASHYEASDTEPFTRSKQEIVNRRAAVDAAGPSYDDENQKTWYSSVPSFSSPYSPGALTQDTLNVVNAQWDYLRWIAGVEPLKVHATMSDELQKGAFVRNWQFSHWLDDAHKPADMDQSLWDEGDDASHSILASWTTPKGAPTQWLNEGYETRKPGWGDYGLGHRLTIISPYISQNTFGFSGNIAIGDGYSTINSITNKEIEPNEFKSDVSAFPAPGNMPSDLING